MSKAQHTPGPWITRGWDIYSFSANPNRSSPVATAVYVGYEENVGERERDANARLIAAAPDEDAANRNTVEKLEYYIDNPSAWAHFDQNLSDVIEGVVNQARAAIAKAKVE